MIYSSYSAYDQEFHKIFTKLLNNETPFKTMRLRPRGIFHVSQNRSVIPLS